MTAKSCRAWMLPLAGGRHVAVGEHELVHIIPEWVRLQAIPRCPGHCHRALAWQGQLIPVFDVHAYTVGQEGMSTDTGTDYTPVICIVAYEDDGRRIGYGGLLLAAIPFRTDVVDDQLCEFPDNNGKWSKVAVSCFDDPVGGRTPVLDLPRMFCSVPGE